MEDSEGHSWYPLEAMLGLLFDGMEEGPGVGSDAVTDRGLERRHLLPEAKRPLDSPGPSLLEQGHLPLLLLHRHFCGLTALLCPIATVGRQLSVDLGFLRIL